VLLRALLQVKIMKTHDPRGIDGPKMPLPDVVVVHTPKDDEFGVVAGGGKDDKVGRLGAAVWPRVCTVCSAVRLSCRG
jgi:hypothetical protein